MWSASIADYALTPHEQDRLLISYAAELARRRQARSTSEPPRVRRADHRPSPRGCPRRPHRGRADAQWASVADDALGTPMACISELHYPDTEVATEGVALALAGGGCLSTWQGERL